MLWEGFFYNDSFFSHILFIFSDQPIVKMERIQMDVQKLLPKQVAGVNQPLGENLKKVVDSLHMKM